jgi:four helix bundle protein
VVDNNVLAEKTLNFAVRVVKCCHYLQEEKKDFVISNQLLRSGTSVGANVHEAVYAQSKADFISKLSIALKEASETSFWLVLLHRTDYLEEKVYVSLKSDIDEIIRITVSSIKITRKNEKYMGD